MINVDRYKITNDRIISMILPFYARGRRIVLFLDAVSHPLKSIHELLMKWMLERKIESSITSQPMSLAWYLNHKFRQHFSSQSDSFQIVADDSSMAETIWCVDEQAYHEGSTPWMAENDSEDIGERQKLVTRNYGEKEDTLSDIVVYAPKIQETTLFTNEMYVNEIRKSIDKYLTIQNKSYQVIIN